MQTHLLNGKVVAITGGCSGIGLAVAKECLIAGATRVHIGDITAGNDAILSKVQQQLSAVIDDEHSFDNKVKLSQLDVSDAPSVDRWIQSIIDESGRLDLAANIAGVAQSAYSRPSPAILHENSQDWNRILDVNLSGVFYCAQAQIRAMIADSFENGAIVNMASLTARTPVGDIYAYGASKAAVAHFTACLAKDVWRYGIRVNAVSPAATDTAMLPVFLPKNSDVHVSSLILLSPDDVAKVIVWLLCDDSSVITGIDLPIGVRG
ncbi:short chain dehydrogenase/oxidoreductase CpoX2 [Colletotrichum cereale]|nr:short chain dehydrogenase/oxidoreductase CpoX2 [Colletotrichum cereale]